MIDVGFPWYKVRDFLWKEIFKETDELNIWTHRVFDSEDAIDQGGLPCSGLD